MPKRILTVDDDEDVRTLIRHLFPEFEVVEAPDGARGLALACTLRPDLIVLDRQMPHLDGLEALRTLRENPQTADIPVVILSSLGEVDERVEGLAAGAFDYLSKPFSPEELRARILGAIQQFERWRDMVPPQLADEDETTTTRGADETPLPSSGPELAKPGTLIDGKYEILAPLGVGGMAVVYRAVQRNLDRVVALKLIRSDRAPKPSAQRRFFREARLASRLDHPNIVRIFDFGRSPEGDLYLAMEYVEGNTLSELLRASGGGLPPQRACELVSQILQGLESAHAAGIMHRDVKSANVVVDEKGRVCVLDFGLAKDTLESADPSMTQRGLAIGTPLYMSPEQAAGEAADARTDLYSVGVVLYELLCGRPPFVGGRSPDILRRHCTEEPEQPSQADEGVPLVLDPIVLKALAKSPENRWPTARAFREALQEVSESL